MLQRILTLICITIALISYGQKKILDHSDYDLSDYDLWNTIKDEAIAPDGSNVLYSLEKGEKDHFFKIQDDLMLMAAILVCG